jgi:signal transduction histidine kinase
MTTLSDIATKEITLPRIRLRTVLIIVNVVVFLLPFVGVLFFRVYENTLVQQTETELISQAAVVSSIYKREILKHSKKPEEYGQPVDPKSINRIDDYYTPINPQLNLSVNKILPSRGDGIKGIAADPLATKIGEEVSLIIDEAHKTTLSGMKVLDFQGISVAGRAELGLDFSGLPEVKRALSGYYTSVIRERVSDSPPPALASISRGTGIRVFVAFPILHNDRVWGIVYLSRTPQNILKHLHAEKWKVIFVACVLLCVSMLMALLTSYMISQPIKRLIKRIERFAKGDARALDGAENIANVQEIKQLSESFVKMAHALNNRADYIRNFAMHVSHEFKTPITAIQGSAELLQDHAKDMDTQKRQKFLSNIIADSDRLKRLVSRLLEMARADNITVEDDTCELRETLEKVQLRYHSTKDFDVVIGKNVEAQIKMSQENLEAILVNLCDNSYQHNASALMIDTQIKDGYIEIFAVDNGTGISKANADKIFTPFFTTRRNAGGTGIGLGIICSILDAHEGTISLIDTKEQGAGFKIQLKI